MANQRCSNRRTSSGKSPTGGEAPRCRKASSTSGDHHRLRRQVTGDLTQTTLGNHSRATRMATRTWRTWRMHPTRLDDRRRTLLRHQSRPGQMRRTRRSETHLRLPQLGEGHRSTRTPIRTLLRLRRKVNQDPVHQRRVHLRGKTTTSRAARSARTTRIWSWIENEFDNGEKLYVTKGTSTPQSTTAEKKWSSSC